MPKPGVFRYGSSAVSTGAFTVYWAGSAECSAAPWAICFHAAMMSMRPAPSSYAWRSLMWPAVEVRAVRSFAGVRSMPCCFAAESSSALAPEACGVAIDVPLYMP